MSCQISNLNRKLATFLIIIKQKVKKTHTRMEELYDREMRDGVRFSWNNFPCNKVAAARVVVPVGCLYTPLKEIENMPLVNYQPVTCKTSGTVLNPFCGVDFRYKTW